MDINQATMIASTLEFPTKSSPKRKSEEAINNRFEVQLLGSKKIKESKSPLGKGNKALYHIINYEEGGFVIISADDRLSPIMAFSNYNPIPFTDEKEYPVGLTDWFINQKDLIEFIRDNPTAEISNEGNIPSNSKINFWDPCPIQRQIAPENLSYDPCDPDGGGGCEDQYTQESPLLTTQWDQDCGFNQLMPTLTCSGVCDRAWVGCVAVAMAQVMRYHNHPQGYNYANMPNNTGNINNAALMADIFNAFPSSQQLVYCFGTGITNTGNNYADVFTSSFGYSSALRASFNSSTVRSNLNNGRPVILGGGGSQGTQTGHMWVTDGYLRAVYCSGQTLFKLHMNWGWNGDGNGYFNYDNFSVTVDGITRSYNNDKYMIYNIIP